MKTLGNTVKTTCVKDECYADFYVTKSALENCKLNACFVKDFRFHFVKIVSNFRPAAHSFDKIKLYASIWSVLPRIICSGSGTSS